jgi:F-type H+-transporting ATPase subunit epsilon
MLHCQLRSPDRTFYEGEALSVTARSLKGEFAVLPHHAPLLAELAAGPVRIKTASDELQFACFGGTVAVEDDRMVILGSEIVPREEIDLEAARRRAADVGRSDAERDVARARLRLLEKVAGSHD